jgi:hypothetical protein
LSSHLWSLGHETYELMLPLCILACLLRQFCEDELWASLAHANTVTQHVISSVPPEWLARLIRVGLPVAMQDNEFCCVKVSVPPKAAPRLSENQESLLEATEAFQVGSHTRTHEKVGRNRRDDTRRVVSAGDRALLPPSAARVAGPVVWPRHYCAYGTYRRHARQWYITYTII